MCKVIQKFINAFSKYRVIKIFQKFVKNLSKIVINCWLYFIDIQTDFYRWIFMNLHMQIYIHIWTIDYAYFSLIFHIIFTIFHPFFIKIDIFAKLYIWISRLLALNILAWPQITLKHPLAFEEGARVCYTLSYRVPKVRSKQLF